MPRHRWFFLALVLASLCAVSIPWIYNQSILLKPEQILKALELWKSRGPSDYRLEYLETSQAPDYRKEFLVQVRNQAPVTVLEDGQFRNPDPSFTIEGLLERMRQMLEEETRAGGSFFATASFSTRDGHPNRFVLRRGKKRFEWVLKLK